MLNIFTLLYNQYPELSHIVQQTLYTHVIITPHFPHPPAPGNHASMHVTTLDISYKWNYTVFTLLGLAYFI